MSYLDRFSIQGLDGDKLTGVVLFGIIAVGFLVIASIVGAFTPDTSPPADTKTAGVPIPAQTPNSIPQVAALTATPTPTLTPNATSTPRPYDSWGSGSSSSSSSSSSHTHSTPTPTPTPILYINNTDSSLNQTIADSLNTTNNESLRNISGINVVTHDNVHFICGNDSALGCYYSDNKSIFIGELQSFNNSSICNNFENTLYHEEAHAIYRSNHSTIVTSDSEIYAVGYAGTLSPDKCSTDTYKALNNSKNSNHTIYQLAYGNYSYWKMKYPALVDGVSPNSIVSAIDLPNMSRDYTNYVYASINYTATVNALNKYLTSDVILSTRPNVICYSVVTYGRNRVTGEYRPFPTTCLLDGWDKVILITPIPTATPNVTATVNVTPNITTTPNVTVSILSSITIIPANKEINVSTTQQFTASLKNQYGDPIFTKISWVSSNETVGVINGNGLFTPLKVGTTEIRATNGSVYGATTLTVVSVSLPPKIQVETTILSFLWITDAHCGVLNDCSDLNIAINKANESKIRYMVDTGDLIEENSTTIDLKTLNDNVTKCTLKLNCSYIPGDHDLTYINQAQWITITGGHTIPYSIDIGEVRLIFLNETPTSMEKRVNWLLNILSTTNKAIIFNHYPLQNSKYLTNILGNTNKVIATFYGEDHKNENGDRFKVNYFIQESFEKGAYSFVNITNNSINIRGYKTLSNGVKAGTYNIPISFSNGLNSLEVPIPELEKIPPPPKLLFLLPEILPITNETINSTINVTVNATPNITSIIPEVHPEVQLLPTHMITSFGNLAIATDVNGLTTSGTLNEVLSSVGTLGTRLLIKNGAYSLTPIHLPTNIYIECESNNAILKTASPDEFIIYLNSNSTIKGCTFDGHNKPIYVKDNVVNWRVENNHFINAKIAVDIENLTSDPLPTSGYGVITNNTGIGSKLVTLMGTRNITISNNVFRNLNDNSEFADFNYNVHFVTFENNSFINDDGYSIDEEAIDMIGGNGFTNSENIIRNNTIIGNFQSGIRPAKSAVNNIIENNYIKYTPGRVINEAGIYLYGDLATYSTPKYNTIRNNRIIGGKYGIVLSGADNNNIYGNTLSGMQYGIGLVKDTIYGANDAPKHNYVWNNNIFDVDYGIFISNSPNNALKSNTIISWIKNIEGQYENILVPSTTPPYVVPENTPIPSGTPITPIITSIPLPSGSCYNVPNGIPSDMQKYVGEKSCISCGHHNPISSSWTPCSNPTPQPTNLPITPQPMTPIDSPTIAYFGDVEPSSSSDASDLTDDLNQVIPLSPTGKVDAVIFMGDMTTSSGTFKHTLQALDASNLKNTPAFFVVGNHEYDSKSSTFPLIQSKYADSVIPMNYFASDTSKNTFSFNVGNIHVININEYWDNGKGDVSTPLYNWIDSQIIPTSYNIVVGHDPLYPASPQNKVNKHVGNSLDENKANRDRLQELFILSGVNIFLGGHTHFANVQNQGNVYHVATGTIGNGITQGEDDFATITYIYSTPNGLVLTQKQDITNPKVTTYNIMVNPTSPLLDIEKSIPQLGVFNREKVPMVDDVKLKWQVISSPEALLSYNNSNSIVAFNYWSEWSNTKSKWTDIAPDGFIQSRFDDAYKYQNYYDYAPFLLHEEMFSPVSLSTWGEPISSWNLEGKATFDGKEVKLLKTWLWEDKGLPWDSSILNDLENPLIVEWDKYYSTQLYTAWNEYIHELGKKSMVIGFMNPKPTDGTYDIELNYQTSANKYILENYDAIVDYSYPQNIREVSFSENKAKYLREKYNGTLLWILTTSFEDMPWDWQESVAQAEFKAVSQNVNGIITYPYTDMRGRNEPYLTYILSFIDSL